MRSLFRIMFLPEERVEIWRLLESSEGERENLWGKGKGSRKERLGYQR